jgi:hypothetical protein
MIRTIEHVYIKCRIALITCECGVLAAQAINENYKLKRKAGGPLRKINWNNENETSGTLGVW